MSDNTFTILGSSSGVPQANRCTSGYVLSVNGQLSLIDCGGGVTSSFLKRGLDPLHVERIFISHTHPDHVCELPLFLQMIYLAGRHQPLDVFVPDEFVKPLQTYLLAVYLIPEKIPFEINIHGYENGFEFTQDFHLTAIGNTHLKPYAELIHELNLPNKMQCHSFQIEIGAKRLFYSADIGGLDDIKPYLDGNDYVVMETTHINLEDFFAVAPSMKVREFVITHLGDDNEVAILHQFAQKAGMENLTTAVDGMELRL